MDCTRREFLRYLGYAIPVISGSQDAYSQTLQKNTNSDKTLVQAKSNITGKAPLNRTVNPAKPNKIKPPARKPDLNPHPSNNFGISYRKYVDEMHTMEDLIGEQFNYIMARHYSGLLPRFRDAIYTIIKHEEFIRQESRKMGIPEDLSLGMAVLENGGGDDMASKWCRGIMQISKTIGKKYGAIKPEPIKGGTGNKAKASVMIDRRGEPEINIPAGLKYLKDLYSLFGDWDLATQAYHCGENGLRRGIVTYLNSYKKWILTRKINSEKIQAEKISWLKLMKNRNSRQYFLRKNDDTANYVTKVHACKMIYDMREALFPKTIIYPSMTFLKGL